MNALEEFVVFRFDADSSKKANARHYKKPYKRLYTKLLYSAKKKEIEVSLSYEDFLLFTEEERCYYCNSKVSWVSHGKEAKSYNLDRKNNSIGYTKNNCVVCCKSCNFLKSNRNEGAFLSHVHRIVQNLGLSD